MRTVSEYMLVLALCLVQFVNTQSPSVERWNVLPVSTEHTKLFIPSSVQFLWNTAIYHHGQPVSYFPRHSAYSHRQGGYVIVVVCLLATLRKNVRTDLNEIFRGNEPMNIWLDFDGDPDHDTGKTCLDGGMHCPSASTYARFLQCFDTVGWVTGRSSGL